MGYGVMFRFRRLLSINKEVIILCLFEGVVLILFFVIRLMVKIF